MLLEINDLEGKFFALCPPLCPYFSPNPKYGHNPERLRDRVQDSGKPGGSDATSEALLVKPERPALSSASHRPGIHSLLIINKKIDREQLSTDADIRSKRTALSAPGRKEDAGLQGRISCTCISSGCMNPGAVPHDQIFIEIRHLPDYE